MRVLAIILGVLLLSSCQTSLSPNTDTAPPGDEAGIVRVLDGDSVIASVEGREIEVRLLGINAPEGDECHGDQARDALEQLLVGGSVILVTDGDEFDQFGRGLRYVFADGRNVNLTLVADGDAIALQGDHSLDFDFTEAGDAAATAGLGMWAPTACDTDPPLPDVAIIDYAYNPPGPDADNPNGEWVAVANTGSAPIDLGGWVLRDESTRHRYRFPNSFELEPQDEVLVHSGCGNDTAEDLYWCAADPVWSNGGDTVILQLPDGTVAARQRFAGDF